jgi:diguanylate cyclase (GGDEF)-like protein/PAS domain S-box-containing protein
MDNETTRGPAVAQQPASGMWKYRFLRKNLFLILIWPIAAALLLWLLWTLTLSKIDSSRAAVSENALTQVTSLSRAYAAQLLHSVEQIDQMTLSLKYDWEESDTVLDLEQQRTRGLYPESSLLIASIIDTNGKIATSSLISNPSVRPSVADLEYFRTHQAGGALGLLISKPSIGRHVQRPVVRFSRRLENADGSFDGVALVSVEPAYLTAFHDESVLGNGDFISVRFADGALLATKTGGRSDVAFYRTDPVFSAPTGVAEEPAEKFEDGQPRFVAWKKLDAYPLVALAALSKPDIFASHNAMARDYRNIAIAGTLFTLLFAIVGMLFSARLAWRRQQEEEVKSTYRLATDAANEGFYMIRPLYRQDGSIDDFQLEDCNERGAAMLGFIRKKIIGRKASELIAESSRHHVMAIYRHAAETGFHEDEVRVSPRSLLRANWVHRRVVRTGAGLALTLRDISEEKEHEQALANLANTDALTALPNRHWLSNFLPTAMEQARERNVHLAILFIDLDNFKNINDSLGHDAGDELLKQAAVRLKASVRASDHVVRLGGDEFMIILEQVDVIDDVARVAKMVIKTIGEPFVLGGAAGSHVNASIGISMFPQDGKDVETLVKHADVAMYAAKAAGKGRYQFYQSHLSDSLLLKLNKEAALRQAIDRDEFVIYYQPRVGTHSGKLFSMEALVRWNQPERGIVLPIEFIDIAEDTGLILKIGELVIEKVCMQLAQWKAQGLAVVPVSVNVSGLQFREGKVSSLLSGCIERYGIDASLIEIEVTESTMLGKGTAVSDELKAIRSLGVKLLIDDFGTGYSSLAQLQRLDVDVLKVDRAFTHSLRAGKEGEALFKAIVSMADALEICVVAEGVETAEQLKVLQELSCDEIQGNFISKPVPANDMPSLMLKRFLFSPTMPVGSAAVI